MRWNFVLAGIWMLLVCSFLDNVRGPILPLFVDSLNLTYTRASLFLVFGSFTAVACTLSLVPLLERFGERRVALAVTGVGLVAALFSQLVTQFDLLMVLAVLLGIVISAMGALCNLLVIKGTDPQKRVRLMSMLHMMYGFGSLLGPSVVAWFADQKLAWQNIFTLSLPPLVALGYAVNRLPNEAPPTDRAKQPVRFSSTQWWLLAAFASYVGGEVMTSMWMVTFLVSTQGMPVEGAAPYLSGFFLVMGLSRGLCFYLRPEQEKLVIGGCLIASIVLSAMGNFGFLWALPLIGLFGPFFPLLLARVSRLFPDQTTRMTLGVMTSLNLTLAVFHLSIGKIADKLGMGLAFWIPALLLCVSLGIVLALFHKERGFRREMLGVSSQPVSPSP